MIGSFYDFLYRSTPAEFKSAFALQESIDRLRAATKRSAFSALAQSAAVGPIKESKVRLQRVIPMVGNSFKPFFIGCFETRADGVYLSGRFTLLPLVKIFMTFWLALAIFIGITVAGSARSQSGGLPAMLGSFGMAGFGIALVAFGKWLARNDIGWLSDVIDKALETPATSRTQTVRPPMAEEGVPMVLRVVAGFLLLSGIVNLVNAVGDWIPSGLVGAQYREPFRAVIAILGVTMLALALGVYHRKLVAWRLGLVFLGATACLSVLQAVYFNAFPGPLPARILFSVLILVVWVFWARWWYAQRVHFLPDDSAWPPRSA